MNEIKTGISYKQEFVVSDKNTARMLGSGSLEVLGTPAMIAFMENTALKVVADLLPSGSDTVGIKISVQHIKASPVGEIIQCEAIVIAVEGRIISYEIKAWDEKGDVIGTANHDRFVVDVEKFMRKLV